MATQDMVALQEQKNALISRMEELRSVDPAEWSPDHDANFNKCCDDIEAKSEEIRQLQDTYDLKSDADERFNQMKEQLRDEAKRRFKRDSDLGVGFKVDDPQLRIERDQQVRTDALNCFIRQVNGVQTTQRQQQAAQLMNLDVRSDYLDAKLSLYDSFRGMQGWSCAGGFNQTEFENVFTRAQSVGTDADGGYTVPLGFQRELERSMLAFGGVRRIARTLRTSGDNPLHYPTVNDTGNSAVLTAEAAAISALDPTYSEVIFNAYKFTSYTIASQELLEDSAFDVSTLMASMLGERLARGQSTYFVTGTGSAQPHGIAVAAAIGKTAASASFTLDETLDLIHSVDPAYRALPSTGFAFNDTTLLAFRKLKDGESRYYWQPGTVAGQPDMLFNYPYVIDQAFADAATTAEFAAFGAWEKFVIREHAGIRFYQLNELLRLNDQVGFAIFSRVDSRLLDAGTDPMKTFSVT